MERRELLRRGAAGVTVALSAAVGGGASAVVAAVQGQQGGGTGRGPQVPVPPPIDRVVNPATESAESWNEPWVWRPADWPAQPLDLNVVENQNPGPSTSPGNRFPSLFSFNGTSPGPTIRLRGDGRLHVSVRNLLGMNHGMAAMGPAADSLELPPADAKAFGCALASAAGRPCAAAPPFATATQIVDHPAEFLAFSGVPSRPAALLTEAANNVHATRVTNLHTHGLHVHPGTNADGSESDNVFTRIIPRADWKMRQASADPRDRRRNAHEHVGQADYAYRLGDVLRSRRLRQGGAAMPQPPGTHWYHPHSHGSTHDQVASGMAGFLIIEGDVDEAINRRMTGTDVPNPEEKTGPFDYRERLVLIQRVEVGPVDLEQRPRRDQARVPPPTAINGSVSPAVMFMRPGAVERWRVLNGSVDGRGFKRLMVLEGQFVQDNRGGRTWRVKVTGTDSAATRELVVATAQDIEDAKCRLYQLALDGITLVKVEDGKARHTIKDLAQQNPGTRSPFARTPAPEEHPWKAALRNFEDCFRDGTAIRNTWLRPNELFLANANRADVFFKAPLDGAGKVYTVFAQEVVQHSDNYQQRLQQSVTRDIDRGNPSPIDVVVGYVHVRGDLVEGGDFDVMSLVDVLPPVPPFLQPVTEDELRIPAAEARRRGAPGGDFRTRVVSYSGYGGQDFPLIEVPANFANAHPELERRVWGTSDGVAVLLGPAARTMATNSAFDLAIHPEPPPPRKFAHHDPEGEIRVLVDTAEEWALYNGSIALWGHTDAAKDPQPGRYSAHRKSYAITRAEGQRRFGEHPDFQIVTKGVDHPFHIHVNPCWVTRIEVPDEQGQLHNVLEEPRWMDTLWIPRGGRTVFRTRFADHVGRWVHHCHILLHEDHGMMQTVDCGTRPERATYNPKPKVATHDMPEADVNAIYPRPSLDLMYRQSMTFVDPTPELGQTYPGFEVRVPKFDLS